MESALKRHDRDTFQATAKQLPLVPDGGLLTKLGIAVVDADINRDLIGQTTQARSEDNPAHGTADQRLPHRAGGHFDLLGNV